jgi:type IV pilus assembly protein PilM
LLYRKYGGILSTTIGIDIGFETVKVIGLDKQGKHWRLKGMNIAPIPVSSWQTDALANQDAIAKTIVDALRLAKPAAITGKRAMIALPESVIFSGTFSMPLLSQAELAEAIPFELAEKLSINLEDFYFDYEVVTTKCKPLDPKAAIAEPAKDSKKSKDDKGKTKAPEEEPITQDGLTVFAVAAKKTLIQSVIELLEQANLELSGIDIKPGAIARSVIGKNDDHARAILDLGAGSTGASIVEGQSIRVTSTVPWGVKALLDKQLTAEELQKEFSPVFDELVHITKFFENRVCPGIRIEEIILSGSGTNIAGVVEVFQQQTGLKARVGSPFGLVDTHHYPVSTRFSHTFADAVGLAMRTE